MNTGVSIVGFIHAEPALLIVSKGWQHNSTERAKYNLKKLVNIRPQNDNLISYVEGLRNAMKVMAVVHLLGFKKQTVYSWIHRGKLQAFCFDGSMRIDPKELARYLRQHQTIPDVQASDRKAA